MADQYRWKFIIDHKIKWWKIKTEIYRSIIRWGDRGIITAYQQETWRVSDRYRMRWIDTCTYGCAADPASVDQSGR